MAIEKLKISVVTNKCTCLSQNSFKGFGLNVSVTVYIKNRNL